MPNPIKGVADREAVNKRVTDFLYRFAIEKEHRRLQGEINDYATELGYTNVWDEWPDDTRPDVLRSNGNSRNLFLGDAKDSENETSGRRETAEEIARYFLTLSELFSDDVIDSVLVVIGTNDQDVANRWCNFLDRLTEALGYIDIKGDKVRFVAEQTANTSWMISPS